MRGILTIAAAVAALTSSQALAANISVNFFGLVTLSEVAGVSVGNGITGHFDYDDTVIHPASLQATGCGPGCVALGGPAALTATIGGGTFSFAGASVILQDNMTFLPDGSIFDGFQLRYDPAEAFSINLGGTLAGESLPSNIIFDVFSVITHDTSFITDQNPLTSFIPPAIPAGDNLAHNAFTLLFENGDRIRATLTATQEGTFPLPQDPGIAVAEPATLAMFATGLFGLGWARRRTRAQ